MIHFFYPTVPEEVTTYTTLIADVQDVHDESSDFELPDTVVAWCQCLELITPADL